MTDNKESPDKFSAGIEALNLREVEIEGLKNAGISTVLDLLKVPESALHEIPGFYQEMIDSIKESLEDFKKR